MEIALSKFCGEDDIISPLASEDESIRKRLGYAGPRNYQLAPITSYRAKDFARLILRQRLKPRFYNHMSAREVVELVGEDIWNSYYKFCIERNPWDRLISLYYWRNKREPRPTMLEFLDSGIPRMLKHWGIEVYTTNGKVVVDKVCRYENLQADLDAIAEKLGLPELLSLPRAKATYRKDRRDPREVLTKEAKERVREMFSDEISTYGYAI